jgi:hypothetical protein
LIWINASLFSDAILLAYGHCRHPPELKVLFHVTSI